jgi:hypothetical protein
MEADILSRDPVRVFARRYRFVPMTVDPELRRRIARGDYDVDSQALAQAIIDRIMEPSSMLEPAEVDLLAALAADDESFPGGDAA